MQHRLSPLMPPHSKVDLSSREMGVMRYGRSRCLRGRVPRCHRSSTTGLLVGEKMYSPPLGGIVRILTIFWKLAYAQLMPNNVLGRSTGRGGGALQLDVCCTLCPTNSRVYRHRCNFQRLAPLPPRTIILIMSQNTRRQVHTFDFGIPADGQA